MSSLWRRTIHPNSLPTIGKLCPYCSKINFAHALDYKPTDPFQYVEHQPSLRDLFNSASSGCGICQLFRYASEVEPESGHDRIKSGGRLYVRFANTESIEIGSLTNVPEPGNESDEAVLARLRAQGQFECLCRVEIFGKNVHEDKSSQLPSLGYLTPPDPDSSSDTSFAHILFWVRECFSRHVSCEKPRDRVLPTRVLEIGSSDQPRVRLSSSSGRKGQWLALSHSWGDFQPLRAMKETLSSLQDRIEWESLPPTFQDAITITRRLGFQYLWIDSLCIIQDSPEDWDREASTMAGVYGNAILTISAEASPNSRGGIFKSANKRRGFHVKLPSCDGQTFSWDIWLRKAPPATDWDFHIGDRAWVLQESLLSARVITYAADQLYWTCRQQRRSEREKPLGGKHELRVLPFTPTTMLMLCPGTPLDWGDKHHISELLSSWYGIVESYAPRSITKINDRLPALAGVAKRISILTGYSYQAGLWEEDMMRGLCWFSHNQTWTSKDYVGPSWSWISMVYLPKERIKHLAHRPLGPHKNLTTAKHVKIEHIGIRHATTDRFMQIQEGSFLKMTALCCDSQYEITAKYGDDNGYKEGWTLRINNKVQFTFSLSALDSWGSPVDRDLLFLHLCCSLQEEYILILEKDALLSGNYVRVGIAPISKNVWDQIDFSFWSVKTVTII